MSVKLWRYKYIATQWPCPEWFHIPLSSEWQALYNIFTWLGFTSSSASDWINYFKMPYAWSRKYSDSNTTSQNDRWFYWSSTNSGEYKAYYLFFYASWIFPLYDTYRAAGYSVRPFYNEWITPNWWWQVLYQGSWSAWIYWHKDLWLITASSNGTAWVTIADKNLWATTVYNSWDELSEENCWGYYQWWNNYMFPWTWTVTTSSTQVDASSYWPGNWYNSSTFITAGVNRWDTTDNRNLWWWVDWNVWKDVESIKYEWKPGSNTVAYFPLTSDFVDVVTWNWPTTSSWDIPFTTKDWVLCASCPSGSVERTYNNRNWSTWNNPLTWHMWCNKNSYSHEWQVAISTWYWTTTRCKAMGFHNNQFWTWWWNNDTYHFDAPIWQWALYTWTFDWNTTKAYLNWELKNSKAMTYSVDSNNYSALFSQVIQSANNPWNSADWYYRDIVMEDRARTAEEIADYYNKTKWTYTWEWWGNDIVNWHSLDEHSMFPQGPCPDGFHVPLNSEWNKIKTFFSSFWILTWWNVCTYLKLAPDWYLSNTGTSKTQSNQYAHSWSNYKGSSWTCSKIQMCWPNYSDWSYNTRPSTAAWIWSTIWMHIRPFKNLIVKPDSSWTTLYDWSSVATWAWIFWNSGLWLITIYDWWDYITIADKNLWATTVWDWWTTYNEANCWKFYQWWNNYAFSFSWQSPGSTTQVDASDYWPGNPYSSSTWINTWTTDWDSSHNWDLWWWVSKSELKQYYSFNLLNEYIWEYHECEVNTMGPCPSGFHIPTRQEWHDLYDIWYALWLWDTTNYWRQLQLQFNIPVCWKLNNDWTYTSSPTDAVYWCADKQSSSYWRDLWLRTTTDVATIDDDTTMIRWGSIRPFRNMPLIPTTSDSNWSIPTGSNPANGWIYDNETEWVISISADWAHWMTLADKNCWATTKWYLNSTMSESNCWKFYQWGNNHWFPFSWATKTSSTAVDASWNWPFSEYYDDDTFIKTSPWDTSDNRNLWGWVSWPTRNCDISWWWWSLWPSTVVCDFRSWASWEATPYSVLVANNNFVAQRSSSYNSISQWNNWTLRLTISRTDYAAVIKLWWWEAWWNWISNAWYNTWNTSSWNTSLKQNLIKKAYLTVSAISSTSYPNFTRAWVFIDFCKKVESSNISNGSSSMAWFVFPRSNYSSYSWYQLYPSDVDVKYLVLPSTPNIAWNWTTCSDYINQWVTSIGSKVILETRWSSPSNLHYWLTIEVTWNEYDLWLCSDLWACSVNVECSDWRQTWSYKEISEAYLEMYDGWYIDYDWNITDTKPW